MTGLFVNILYLAGACMIATVTGLGVAACYKIFKEMLDDLQ